jgi:hypothetical protein
MKEIQLHVFLHRLIGQATNSRKFVIDSLLCYIASRTWLNIFGRDRWVKSQCRLTCPGQWLLANRIWTRDKLPLLMILFFFISLPRIRFIIIINENLEKAMLFLMLLSVFCRSRRVDFLIIFFFIEQRIRLRSLLLEILHIHIRI